MSLNVSQAFKARMLSMFAPVFNGGVIYIYSGTQPASPSASPTGTLLATVTLDGLPHTLGSTTNGLLYTSGADGYVVLSPGLAPRMTVVTSGVAGWARVMAFDDSLQYDTSAHRIDCGVNDGTPGVPATLLMETPTLTAGEVLPVGYFIYAIPPFGV